MEHLPVWLLCTCGLRQPIDHFLWGLYQLNQNSFATNRTLLIPLGVNKRHIVSRCSFPYLSIINKWEEGQSAVKVTYHKYGKTILTPPGVNRTPWLSIHVTAAGRSSTHNPMWFNGGTCTLGDLSGSIGCIKSTSTANGLPFFPSSNISSSTFSL